jgi:hypothetical protein
MIKQWPNVDQVLIYIAPPVLGALHDFLIDLDDHGGAVLVVAEEIKRICREQKFVLPSHVKLFLAAESTFSDWSADGFDDVRQVLKKALDKVKSKPNLIVMRAGIRGDYGDLWSED